MPPTTAQKSPNIMTPEEMQAKRELDAKPFSEITDAQKIDRLVVYIEMLQQGSMYQGRSINEVQGKLRLLMKHEHGGKGQVVLDAETVSNHGGGSESTTLGRQLPLLH